MQSFPNLFYHILNQHLRQLEVILCSLKATKIELSAQTPTEEAESSDEEVEKTIQKVSLETSSVKRIYPTSDCCLPFNKVYPYFRNTHHLLKVN